MKKMANIAIEQAAKSFGNHMDRMIINSALGIEEPKAEPRQEWMGYLIDGEYHKPTGFEAMQDQGQEGGDERVRELVERRIRHKGE